MSERTESPPIVFFIILVVIEMAGYIVLVLAGHEDDAQRIGELLTITVVAIISYYLGWARRHVKTLQSSEEHMSKYGHVTKARLYRLAYILWGFGIGLLLEHIVTSGWDFELEELLLGHEYIALYSIIGGIVLFYWAKSIQTQLKRIT